RRLAPAAVSPMKHERPAVESGPWLFRADCPEVAARRRAPERRNRREIFEGNLVFVLDALVIPVDAVPGQASTAIERRDIGGGRTREYGADVFVAGWNWVQHAAPGGPVPVKEVVGASVDPD